MTEAEKEYTLKTQVLSQTTIAKARVFPVCQSMESLLAKNLGNWAA